MLCQAIELSSQTIIFRGRGQLQRRQIPLDPVDVPRQAGKEHRIPVGLQRDVACGLC